jgi:signal transduction histidine kinase
MKKHAIGQTIFNINNWWNLLKLAREKGSGIVDDNAELGTNRKVKVADIYSNLEVAISKLSTQLSKFDTGYGLQTEEIDLTLFVDKYISEHKSPIFEFINNSKVYQIEDDMPEIEGDDTFMVSESPGDYNYQDKTKKCVKFAPDALTIVFDNIISNACAHGFKDRESERNLISIDIVAESTDYVITISNNGEPIVDLTPEEVFTYSLTTGNTKEHFGIGGYEIKKLMKEFRGDAEIISTPNEPFTVTYRLIFHDTK